MSIYSYEKAKDKRIRRMEAGRCIKGCPGPVVTAGGMCEKCRANACRYAKERLARLRETVPPKRGGGRRAGSGRKKKSLR